MGISNGFVVEVQSMEPEVHYFEDVSDVADYVEEYLNKKEVVFDDIEQI